MTPKPQTNTLDEIKNSHTMKLVPLSQRELFWHELKPKLQALITEARIEAEISLARKVLGVSSQVRKKRGLTQGKRLEIISSKMLEIIPDSPFPTEEYYSI